MPQPTRSCDFVQVDVFTARPLEGNSLAVFTDARGLSDEEMQALAHEMNLSETTFVLPRPPEVEREQGVRVRIFTVAEELPFAGHPTLGTAWVLHSSRGGSQVLLDLNVGRIPVSFSEDGSGEMRQRDPEFGSRHSPADVASATGLEIADLADDVPIQTVSTGLPFTIVPVRRLERLQKFNLFWPRAAEYLERSGGGFFYFVCRETVDPAARLHARMIFYNGEDPATGSAAGCAAAWMAAHAVTRSGESAIIEQGLEMRRPSRIVVRADKVDDRVVNVRVGGEVVEVIRGRLRF